MKKLFIYIFFIPLAAGLFSCTKSFLGTVPSSSLATLTTVQACQKLLDNETVFTNYTQGLGTLASDEYYLTYASWQTLQSFQQNAYIWSAEPYGGLSNSDWDHGYAEILQANVVLNAANNISETTDNKSDLDNVKGSALFYRAFSFYDLSQAFCKQYDSTTANTDLGLPLRLSADVNDKSVRATLQQTYSQIFSDLQAARGLLPVTPLYKTRPSLPAVYGLLARIYLSVRDYKDAGLYADSCLQLSNTLLDFNTLTPSYSGLKVFNDEVIFHTLLISYSATSVLEAIVDSSLFYSYSQNDLRSKIFFYNYNNAERAFASYAGALKQFAGIATDEMYLIRAECYARNGNIQAAMSDLNTLLRNRYVTGTFTGLTASDETTALTYILQERRKELLFRGLRWSDLRRLNTDPRFAVTLTRNLNGQIYTLPPNDPRYVFPIPPDEIQLSGIQQNP